MTQSTNQAIRADLEKLVTTDPVDEVVAIATERLSKQQIADLIQRLQALGRNPEDKLEPLLETKPKRRGRKKVQHRGTGRTKPKVRPRSRKPKGETKLAPGSHTTTPSGKQISVPARPAGKGIPASGGWFEYSYRNQGQHGPYWTFRWGKGGPGESKYVGKRKS